MLGKNFVLFSKAAPVFANIKIDVAQPVGNLRPVWTGFAQGGELDKDRQIVKLSPIAEQIKTIPVNYIRIDHVLDFEYEQRLREIIELGAVPIISISYFPKHVAATDLGTVTNWEAWQEEVRKLVRFVSGSNGLNLSNIYYEVWNEPDGEFGGFKVGQGKDYLELYKKTFEAINTSGVTNPVKIGGPSMADPRRCLNGMLGICREYWLEKFLEEVGKRGYPLDFISWHRYSKRIIDFEQDIEFVNALIDRNGFSPTLPKIVSEWGSDPKRDPIHFSLADAAHMTSVNLLFEKQITIANKFELRDGEQDKQSNIGWGILTYDGVAKPTYKAFNLLKLLRREKVALVGEGTFVRGIATRDEAGYTILLSNYDDKNVNIENVPVEIVGVAKSKYRVIRHIFDKLNLEIVQKESEVTVVDGKLNFKEILIPNSIIAWDILPLE